MMNIQKILQKMTLEEKIALCEGGDFWDTMSFSQYDISPVKMCDGPNGLRKQEDTADMIGVNASIPATCFPTAATTGCSWDPKLTFAVGRAVCEEARANDVSLILGPGLNIKRNPLCGRNFEYYSEDPLLSGKLAAGYVRGGQETGVSCCLKHFAGNSQEYKRFLSNSVMDERTFREIYLRGFEIAVKEGKPRTVMCSYNKNNGIHASDDKQLLTDILRNEWGFTGMVVTDWGGMNDRIKAFQAGCDLNMPGGSKYQQKKALKAIQIHELSEADVNRSAQRVLTFIEESQHIQKKECSLEEHYELARRAAVESAVLLKNNGALPLKGTACMIGAMARNIRFQGSGSSHINPYKITNPTDIMDLPYAKGCNDDGSTTDMLIKEAVALAKTVNTPVIFAGLPANYESEGFDRSHMRMPEGSCSLIEAVAEVNPNAVVVLLSGSVVEVPWIDRVNAILYMGLPGEAGGQATADLLTGKANPCGKLAETWPVSYEDVITKDFYGKKDAEYREGVFVGYRYYDRALKRVRFPFGYGLSYTTFSYERISLDGNTVSVTLKNTGTVPGAEVVQLYVYAPQNGICRPLKELRGFKKVHLQPEEERSIQFGLDEQSFAVWSDGWKVPSGTYSIECGGLKVSIEKSGVAMPIPSWQNLSWYETFTGIPSHKEWEEMLGFQFHSDTLKVGEFTMDNSILEMKDHSFIMNLMYRAIERSIAKSNGGKVDYSDATFRMLITSSADCALRGIVICGGMKESVFKRLLYLANHNC
jgi:beta-glucosidase